MNEELRLNWEEFAQRAGHWPELFDKSFANEAVPIHARPLRSAMVVAIHFAFAGNSPAKNSV